MGEHDEERLAEIANVGTAKKIVHSTNLEFRTALSTMGRILEAARDGNFMIEVDDKSINLVPAAEVQFEITAKEEEDRQSIAFELKWTSRIKELATEIQVVREGIEGDRCVADQIQMNREAAERDYAEIERRFERELFGGCGCVEVPGPE
jgi:amphi-Trp domain-containing protein